MKRTVLTLALISTFLVQKTFAAADTTQPALAQLLNSYYEIKNNLVSGNASTAATKSDEFLKAIENVDIKNLSEADAKAFTAVQEKLKEAAKSIASSTDLSSQRKQFSSFSDNMISLAKGAKLSNQPVYEAYCPMKKAYWLTDENKIKNPYYGSSMLTCGKITQTFQ